MRPAYTNIPDSDLLIDKPITTDLMTALRDNAASARITLVGTNIAEQTTTTAGPTGVLAGTFNVWVPDLDPYTLLQRTITFWCEVKQNSGTSMSFYLEDAASSNTSPVETESGTNYVEGEATLDIDSLWAGSVRTINVWFYATGGATAFLRAPNSFASRLEF